MKKTIIIAEAGVNHNGSLKMALEMVSAAADCGVDYIKFQTFKADRLALKTAEKAEYQKNNSDIKASQYEMLKSLEMDDEFHKAVYQECLEKNIGFLSSPFDIESIDLLQKMNLDYMKIPSGEINNVPYLEVIAQTRKPIILSTGMATLSDIELALKTLESNGSGPITILQCNTDYPTQMSDVNLRAMETLRLAFGVDVGYSDHTNGIEVSIAAVALGATIIEKHFTLDRSLEGPDHKASLEIDELRQLVESIRNVELALGSSRKVPSESEMKNINIVRKSIVASRKILKNEVFTSENLTTKRPGNGISPSYWHVIIGKRATKDYDENEVIQL